MHVRKPDVDFSQTSARWAPHGEFAQQMNASSLWIPHLERFLNRVMSQANAKLDASNPRHARLKADIRTFIRQEGNHTALHAAFNAILPRAGYDVAHFNAISKRSSNGCWLRSPSNSCAPIAKASRRSAHPWLSSGSMR